MAESISGTTARHSMERPLVGSEPELLSDHLSISWCLRRIAMPADSRRILQSSGYDQPGKASTRSDALHLIKLKQHAVAARHAAGPYRADAASNA